MFRVGLLAIALSAAAFAQTAPIETQAPQQVVPSVRPLVTTPTMTLSNGFSPATVNMPQTIVSESPEEVVRSAMPQGEEGGANVSEMNANALRPSDFNFAAVAETSVFNTGFAGPSLGEIAKKYGKEHVQAHQTFTNEDIDHLTSSANDESESGIIYARLANGQPITDRNQDGFSPMSGIANMPDVNGDEEGSQMANDSQANPMNENQGNATASNQDQGQENGEQATTPAANHPAADSNANQQNLPASDNPK